LHSSASYLAIILRIEQYINRLVAKLFSQLGDTPLHRAVDGGHSEMVKQILLSQVNVDVKNNVSSAICSVSTNTLILNAYVRVELDGSPARLVGWV
jgi:ankyrin repeat protein